MSPSEFNKNRKEALGSSDKLLEEMSALEQRMAKRVAQLIGALDSTGGKINVTPENAARIAEITSILKGSFADAEWLVAVTEYLKSYDLITENVIDYGKTLGTVEEEVLKAINRNYKQAAAEYLTNPSSFTAEVWIPLNQKLGALVLDGTEVDTAIGEAMDLLTGTGEVNGALRGITTTTTVNDLTSIYDRTATKTMGEQVGAEFFFYQGSEIDTTREFCAERHGHAYMKSEVEGWASLDWAGKIPETTSSTIFDFLGGYNCRHILVPIAKRDVPPGDLARMKGKGLIE